MSAIGGWRDFWLVRFLFVGNDEPPGIIAGPVDKRVLVADDFKAVAPELLFD